MPRLTYAALQHFAQSWIDSWNRHDIDSVLSHFSEDAVFVSPRAHAVTGNAWVTGKAALKQYWSKALAAVPDLHFELETITCDETGQTLVVHYTAHRGGKRIKACEMMRFENGQQVYGEAYYGAAL